MKEKNSKYTVPTRLIYGHPKTTAWDYKHHVIPPLTTSSTFRLSSAQRGSEGFAAIGVKYPDEEGYEPIYVYDRMGEPNNDILQQNLAIAEGKDSAVTFATGMAAVSAAACFSLKAGDEIISHTMVYGCTYSLFNFWLGRYGFKVNFTDFSNPDSFLEFVTDKTRVIYLESPANPTLQLIDIEAVMSRVKQINSNRSEDRQIITVIDNTFATPFCQRPGEFGVDVIVHSLTKGISGFGTEMGGAVVADRKFLDSLILYRKDFGGNLSPSTAWHILVYGISTMPLRIQKSQSNAMKVAEYLEQHPKVENVRYPGLESFPQYEIATRMLKDFDGNFAPGIIIYFTLKSDSLEGSKSDGEKMMNFIADNSYCITLAVSLGQLRTLIEHPGSMTHAAYSAEEQMKIGMHPGGVRLAVGIESADDIIKDLDAALSQL